MIQTITEVYTKYNKEILANELLKTEIEVIEKDELLNFIKSVYDNSLTEISDGQSIYFHKKATYPRKKFSKGFPNNPIVRYIDDADVVVLDISRIISENIVYFSKFIEVDGGWKRVMFPVENRKGTYFGRTRSAGTRNPSTVNIIDTVKHLTSKLYIDVKYLDIPAANDFTDEMYSTISSMLENGPADIKNLAMRMLTGIKYKENKLKLGLFFCENSRYWLKLREKKISVEIKTLLNKIAEDFPGYNSGSTSIRDNIIKKIKKQMHELQTVS